MWSMNCCNWESVQMNFFNFITLGVPFYKMIFAMMNWASSQQSVCQYQQLTRLFVLQSSTANRRETQSQLRARRWAAESRSSWIDDFIYYWRSIRPSSRPGGLFASSPPFSPPPPLDNPSFQFDPVQYLLNGSRYQLSVNCLIISVLLFKSSSSWLESVKIYCEPVIWISIRVCAIRRCMEMTMVWMTGAGLDYSTRWMDSENEVWRISTNVGMSSQDSY